jgi:hypothetical protein
MSNSAVPSSAPGVVRSVCGPESAAFESTAAIPASAPIRVPKSAALAMTGSAESESSLGPTIG